jgi:hypothetical protein
MAKEFAESTIFVGTSGQGAAAVDNALRVRQSSGFADAVRNGWAFSFASVTYDPDAHDTIIGVSNDDTVRDLYIQKIMFTSDTASQIQIFYAAKPTMAGTAITPVNLNRASGRSAPATAKCDETGNGEQAASYTRKILQRQVNANEIAILDIEGSLIVPYNYMIGIDLTTAATAANATIWGWFN